MANFLIKKAKKVIKDEILKHFPCFDFIQNINLDLCLSQRRVLLVYLTTSLKVDFKYKAIKHSNVGEVNQIIKYFLANNFVLDVISLVEANYESLLYDKSYDIIIGMGPIYEYACGISKDALKIFYLTENNPTVAAKKYQERYDNYFKRHNRRPKDIQRLSLIKESQLEVSDYGILLNSEFNAMASRAYFRKSYLLNPTGIVNNRFVWEGKDFKNIKRNYLWFGSSGVIHKGLDVLVDAFNILETCWQLRICGVYESEKKVLKINSKTITYAGFIDVHSNSFLDLIQNTTFVILPSCSEGISTGVITCMMHGLIPIVTREAGVELPDDIIYYIEDLSPEGIADLVRNLDHLTDEELARKSHGVYQYANNVFNITRFTESFNASMDNILSDAEKGRSIK